MPVSNVSATFAVRDVMNVEVPSIEVSETKSDASFLYAFAEMTSEADYSVEKISRLVGKLLKLAEIEKPWQCSPSKSNGTSAASTRSSI